MLLQVSVNNAHVCEFYSRIPMYLAQQLEVKGEINLESVQTDSGTGSSSYPPTGGDTGYCPPPPDSTFGGDMGYCPPPPDSTFGGNTGYCPPPPDSTYGGDMGYCPPPPDSTFGGNTGYCPPPPDSTFGGDMGYCPPPPQSSFDSGFNTGYPYPSAPSSFTVCFIDICREEFSSHCFYLGKQRTIHTNMPNTHGFSYFCTGFHSSGCQSF